MIAIHEHLPVVRRYKRGMSMTTHGMQYGYRVTCSCGDFSVRVNDTRKVTLQRWWSHIRALTQGVYWHRFGPRSAFVCQGFEINSAERCSRRANWGLRRRGKERSPSESVFCTQHARLYGLPKGM